MFNVGEAKEEQSFELLPEGNYEAEVTAAEIKANDKGDNRLNITFTIADGPHKGRKVWDSPWITHSNPKAQAFGNSRIKSIMKAAGASDFSFGSSDDFLTKTMGTVIDISVGTDTYNDRTKNKVTFVKAPAEEINGGMGTTETRLAEKGGDVPSLDQIPF